MKGSLALALATGLAVLGGAGQAEAQEMMGRRASLFDLGFYGGAAYTSPWFESRMATTNLGVITGDEDGESNAIGFAPMFGGNATFYGLPWFGVRVHYGYMPSDLPSANDEEDDQDADDYFVNNHFYDLSLVFRAPGIPLFGSVVSDAYLWLGGGGLSTDVAGEGADRASAEGATCVPRLLAKGACLSMEPEYATVGQGVVGIGGDIVSLASNIGLFLELAAHIYDSPVHVGDAFVPRVTVPTGGSFAVADDKYAVTGRGVIGLKFAFGGGMEEVVPVPVPVAPAPAPAPVAPPAPAMQPVTVCVVQGNALMDVQAQYNPATGDTMVNNRRFREAYPATAPAYAANESWFINNQPVTFQGQEYVRFGVPRIIGRTQLMQGGMVQGVNVFTETGTTGQPQVIYVPLRPGCEFQPYQLREQIRVRG